MILHVSDLLRVVDHLVSRISIQVVHREFISLVPIIIDSLPISQTPMNLMLTPILVSLLVLKDVSWCELPLVGRAQHQEALLCVVLTMLLVWIELSIVDGLLVVHGSAGNAAGTKDPTWPSGQVGPACHRANLTIRLVEDILVRLDAVGSRVVSIPAHISIDRPHIDVFNLRQVVKIRQLIGRHLA